MGTEHRERGGDRSAHTEDLPDPSGSLGRTPGERLVTRLAPWFYWLYLLLLGGRQERIREIDHKLDQANVPLSAEQALSGILGLGVLLGVPFALLLAVLAYPLPDIGFSSLPGWLVPLFDFWSVIEPVLEVPLILALAIGLGICLGLVSVYYSSLLFLGVRVRGRKRRINLLLADAIAYLHAQSDGGMGTVELIENMAESEATYDEIAVEFSRIQHRIDYFGESYQTAIAEVADITPSEEFAQFLNDMLSVVNSGGDMTYFLDQQRSQRLSALEQAQENRLDLIEMVGQFYISASMAPLFVLIIIVIQSLLGSRNPWILAGTTYLVIPFIALLFLAAISTLKHDDPGEGYLPSDRDGQRGHRGDEISPFSLGIVEEFAERYDDPLFAQARRQEIKNRIGAFLNNPLRIFRQRPATTLFLTVPLALLAVVIFYASGVIGPSISQLQDSGLSAIVTAWEASPVWQTVGWVLVPAYITLVPFSYYYERTVREREGITATLTQDLRKLSNHNESGHSILDSIKMTASSSESRLATELGEISKRVEYGEDLSTGLIAMNNRYAHPRLARMIQLIEQAQRTSNQISDILRAATKLSETRDSLDSEYESQMQTQLTILVVTTIVFLGVLAFLRVLFLPVIADLVAGNEQTKQLVGGSGDLAFVNLIFFHGAVMHGLSTGLLIGYVRKNDPYRGIKWMLGFATLAVVVWAIAGLFV